MAAKPPDATAISERVAALVAALNGRLPADVFGWASEYANAGEWELALVNVHEAAEAGQLVLTDDEASELFGLEAVTNRRMIDELLEPGRKERQRA